MRTVLLNLGKILLSWLLLSYLGYGADNGVMTKDIFIPVGFDDNDEIVVVVDGFLQNSCYKMTTPKVDKSKLESEHLIVITPKARLDNTEICLPALIPFTQVVSLESLAEGKYTVATNDGQLKEPLVVTKSTVDTRDDYLYAAVEQVYVHFDPIAHKNMVMLSGRFTNTCMSWDYDKTKLYSTGKTLQLLPVMKIKDGTNCKATEIPFTVPMQLPKLGWGRYLLHVRSASGLSVNQVFSVFHLNDE